MNARRLILSVVAAVVGSLVFACASALAAEAPEAGAGSSSGCPNEQRRSEQPFAQELPDCRAYEMVSPTATNGQDATDDQIEMGPRAGVSGDEIVYASRGSFAGGTGANIENEMLSRRGPQGWSTQNITPAFEPHKAETGDVPYLSMAFTPELDEAAFSTSAALTPEAPKTGPDETDLYLGSLSGSHLQYLAQTHYPMSASPDLSHLLLGEGGEIVEWSDGETFPVSMSNTGTPTTASVGGAAPDAQFRFRKGDTWHALSSDGSRAYFLSSTFTEEEHFDPGHVPPRLFVRLNPEQPQSPMTGPSGEEQCAVSIDACTIEVSASQRATPDPHGPQPARFWGASADGDRVFFTSTAQLTEDAYTGPEDNAANLYEYDVESGRLSDLTVDTGDIAEGAAVRGVAGEVSLNSVTGQLTTTFKETPQFPINDFRLSFFGTARAPLSTPAVCGAYTTVASLEPWSGTPGVKPTSSFHITSGPDGTSCQDPRPFQPVFEAGTTNIQAGAFTPLTMTMTRPDADQALGKLSVVFPPGISAGLQGVKLCEEPQAASGECPAESQIGQVIASPGLGNDPYSVEDGKAYITGPYGGAPFGVDVVVPAVAGPFNLGTELVRSKVEVDPTDAHLTVVSNPFPTILDGIPLQLQHINVTVNRPGFVFNPTNCVPMKLTGELESSEGATADVSNPFQVTNCAALSFKPEFEVSTTAKTSRTEGASLHVTLTLPNTPRGTAANVAKVKVSLPKQLPSPLKTLQKACTEKVFAENPSNCPKASRVGEATVQTPVLEGPLSRPGVLRLPRWREVPGTDHRLDRRGWRDGPGAWGNVHQ